jgi:hypothetical protein
MGDSPITRALTCCAGLRGVVGRGDVQSGLKMLSLMVAGFDLLGWDATPCSGDKREGRI